MLRRTSHKLQPLIMKKKQTESFKKVKNHTDATLKKAEAVSVDPISTAKKHWIVYLPLLLIVTVGIAFLTRDEIYNKVAGIMISLFGLLQMVRIATIKWHLTSDHIYIQQGWPWAKKVQQVPVLQVYQSTASSKGILGRYFNIGTITTTGRDGVYTNISDRNISNASAFSFEIAKVISKSPINPLNKIYALKENGAVSQSEYDLIKLGMLTNHFLS